MPLRVVGRGLRNLGMDSLLFTLLAATAGAIGACGALALLTLIDLVGSFYYGTPAHARGPVPAGAPAWHILLATTLGGLIVGILVAWLVKGRRTYGPADVLEAVHERNAALSARVGIESAVASALSIGCGASVGRYGPAVHLGASLSAWVGQAMHLDRPRRVVLIACGVAAAIAASFNAPLAGVLFAYEFLLGTPSVRSFVPITVASVTGTTIARTHLGDVSIFPIAHYTIGHSYEYILFAVTGALAGTLAIALMRSIDGAVRAVGRSSLPRWLRPAIGGLLVGLIGTQFPQVLGLGEDTIEDTLNQRFDLSLLLALMAMKLLATTVSLGFGFSGGVFGPALFVGAALGDAVGQFVTLAMPGLVSEPAIYAVAGMGALISCVIGAPLTTILMVFELTGSYSVTTAVMVAVVFGSMIIRPVFAGSFFRFQLEQRGVDVSSGREVSILRARTVAEIMSADYPAVGPETPLSEALLDLPVNRPEELLVLSEAGRLIGIISVVDVTSAVGAGRAETPAGRLARVPDALLEVGDSLHTAMRKMEDFMGITVPVVDDRERLQVVGVLHEGALLRAYGAAVDEARREERGEL